MKVGLVTIGQSPRDDLVPEIRRYLPKRVRIREAGALDGLSPEEIALHPPQTPERTLVTRLHDGSEISVDMGFVHQRLLEVFRHLSQEVELIGLLCSGRFPPLQSPVPLLVPHELLRGFVASLSLPGPLGVLVPSSQQIGPTEEEFRDWGVEVVVQAASPYHAPIEEIKEQAKTLVKKGATALLLNCFGYSIKTAELLRRITGRPVVSVRGLFAIVLAELV